MARFQAILLRRLSGREWLFVVSAADGKRKSGIFGYGDRVRAKPIALTGLAAMLGVLFILDDPIFSRLAISLIFGILVSTLLTLVVMPVMYYAFRYKHPVK